MSIAKHLEAIAQSDRQAKENAKREKRFDDARGYFHSFRERLPWGSEPKEWAERFRAYLVAARHLESLASDKPTNRIGSDMTLTPFSRLRSVAAEWAAKDTDYGTPMGELVLLAIDKPKSLPRELAAILKSPRAQSLQIALESLVDSAINDPLPEPIAAQAPPPKPAIDLKKYDGPHPPQHWCKDVFKMSATKFRNLRRNGDIIAHALTTKSVYVHKASIAKYSPGAGR